jgi:hypothetical protein
VADQLRALFDITCRRLGLDRPPKLSAEAFRRPEPGPQIELFV